MEQRRGKRIAMVDADLDAFLGSQRTCRLASVGKDGWPHNSPLWFVWSDGAVWINTLVRSQRWRNLERNPKVSVVVDAGEAYGELRGVEIQGTAEAVGEAPRTGEPEPELVQVEDRYGVKYSGGRFVADGRHAWVRVVPTKIMSWDFRKLG